jgi:acetolactate synthase I/II/III large subunit
MNGAELIMKTAKRAGIEVCFTNFGTSEMSLAMAFDTEPGVRPVLGLFEGVCTGAADGWGRMKDKPAMTLLHLGPGLANGTANLHNARKARTPLINLVGEHTSLYKLIDSPLAMNIEPLASTVSGWYKTVKSADDLSKDMAEAWAASMYGQIATLIIPMDFQSKETSLDVVAPGFAFEPMDEKAIEQAGRFLLSHQKTVLLLGGRALRKSGLVAAARIQALTGCDLLTNHVPAYTEREPGLPYIPQLPYFAEQQIEILSRYEAIVLAGAKEPTCFFGYEGLHSHLLPENQPRVYLVNGKQSVIAALENLAESLKGKKNISSKPVEDRIPPNLPEGELNAEKACLTLAAIQPENAVVVDEGVSSSFTYYHVSRNSQPHTILNIEGGATGWGLPCSVGVAIACPDRPVIDLQADGCGMYTVQALWTQSREKLNIITLICSNRRYNILKLQLDRAKASIGPRAYSLMDLENPDLNWVKIAGGLGIPAVAVNTVEGLVREFKKASSESGPHLIEMVLR